MIRTRIHSCKDGYSQLQISPRLALMYRALKRPGKEGRRDRIQCAYFGFLSEQDAQAFATHIRRTYQDIRAVVREADRLPECAFEVKVWEHQSLMPLVFHCAKKTA